jgi:hypothetical protein
VFTKEMEMDGKSQPSTLILTGLPFYVSKEEVIYAIT